jgi:hypothetical protein
MEDAFSDCMKYTPSDYGSLSGSYGSAVVARDMTLENIGKKDRRA